MENLRLVLGNDKMFDELVNGGLPQASDLTLCTKDHATQRGMPAVVISFDVQLPDGTVKKVQAVTTVRLLVGFYSAMKGRYGPGGPEGHRMPGAENPFIW